ncbi:MAG TPA: hypothetical protein VKT80_09245, partial [Chloroflexota bacterium]|nr:hypothetical protein [Chloroflexota bacterium]
MDKTPSGSNGVGARRRDIVLAGAAAIAALVAGLTLLARPSETRPQSGDGSRSSVPPYRPSTALRLLGLVADWLDHKYKWHHFSTPIGAALLVGLRERLRERNLFDTETVPHRHSLDMPSPPGTRHLTARQADGSFNSLEIP